MLASLGVERHVLQRDSRHAPVAPSGVSCHFFCAALLAAFQNGCPCLKYDTITRAGKGQRGTGGASEWCCGVCGHWDLADRHKKGKEEKREEEEEEQRRLGSKSRNWRILTWLKVRKCCCCCFCWCLLCC